MKADYTYCLNNGSCLHRLGCNRYLGNYSDNEVHELYTNHPYISHTDESQCLPDYLDVNNDNSFQLFDRFRYSDGTAFNR
jgi:hypothetical protein